MFSSMQVLLELHATTDFVALGILQRLGVTASWPTAHA